MMLLMMMMSRLRGCNINLVMMIFFSFLLLLVWNTPMVVLAGRENLLVEMMSSTSSRSSLSLSEEEELVKMAGYGDEKLSTVLVTGTLLCHDPCLAAAAAPLPPPHPVPGASVAVSCTHTASSSGKRIRKLNWVQGITDEYGDFLIDLPSHLHAVPNLEKLCLVKVFQLPNNSLCRPAFTGKHKGITLSSSVRNGIRTYTAQRIYLTHKSSQACPRRKKIDGIYAGR